MVKIVRQERKNEKPIEGRGRKMKRKKERKI